VNKSWLCDEGRMSFHALNAAPRLLRPRLQDKEVPVSWDEALAATQAGLRANRRPGKMPALAALVSTSAANETLLLFKRYVTETFAAPLLDCRLSHEDELVDQREDSLLLRRDKHPNTRGALLLGLTTPFGGLPYMLERVRAGEIDAALILYYPPLVRREDPATIEALRALLEAAPFSVVLTTHEADWLAPASVLLPVAAWSEEEGTYTNHAGVVQWAGRAVAPPGEARPAAVVSASLLALSGRAPGSATPAERFRELTAAVPAYTGLVYDDLASRQASVYPPEGRLPYGQEGFAGH
ncbi:MAG: molybdopterin-dependent oxidoreductase, partial [Chloroflexota bacterium]